MSWTYILGEVLHTVLKTVLQSSLLNLLSVVKTKHCKLHCFPQLILPVPKQVKALPQLKARVCWREGTGSLSYVVHLSHMNTRKTCLQYVKAGGQNNWSSVRSSRQCESLQRVVQRHGCRRHDTFPLLPFNSSPSSGEHRQALNILVLQFVQVKSCGLQTVFIYFLVNNTTDTFLFRRDLGSSVSVVLFGSHVFLLSKLNPLILLRLQHNKKNYFGT